MTTLQFIDDMQEPEPVNCKGLIFRCKINNFTNGLFANATTQFRLLKRKSCKGCEKCYWIEEALSEQMDCDNELPPVIPSVESGAMYKLEVTETSTDWESGLCDGYTLGFVKVEENEIIT